MDNWLYMAPGLMPMTTSDALPLANLTSDALPLSWLSNEELLHLMDFCAVSPTAQHNQIGVCSKRLVLAWREMFKTALATSTIRNAARK